MRARLRDMGFLVAVLGGTVALGAGLLRPLEFDRSSQKRPNPRSIAIRAEDRPGEVAARVDVAFLDDWKQRGIAPAAFAPDLAVMRRLALGLRGSVPSLEEIREFESWSHSQRIDSWLDHLLNDRRCADYLAERFARAFVGVEGGPFIKYRRDRFVSWLSDQFFKDRPYDEIVRDLIAGEGLWTDHPEVNFISVTTDEITERPRPERLAARVSRAFLGIRIDCAQCHDHPFQPWKQSDFRGLSAFFGAVHSNLRGVRDEENDYRPPDARGRAGALVEPRVPFLEDLVPASGGPREKLASWITDRRNPNFARATVNRVWALLTGRPLVAPIDDMAAAGTAPQALAVLAEDFAKDYRLHRLIRAIAATRVFRLDSADEHAGPDHESAWAVFPLSRLRPEQVAGAIFQSASLTTLGPDFHWLARLVVLIGRGNFVFRYGDPGEDEFDDQSGTVPQRLLMMNGAAVRQLISTPFLASGRIASQAADDGQAIEAAYLATLGRHPTPEEAEHFRGRIAGARGDARKQRLADLYWALLNSTEFSWNH